MNNAKRTIGFGLMIIAIMVFAHTIYGSVFYASTDTSSLNPLNQHVITTAEASSTVSSEIISSDGDDKTNPELPNTLIIPSLDIEANVQYVGTNSKGNMGTPNNFTDVSWYKPGTIPGETGSAVMAGHVDNGLSLSGVFKHLENIKAGDDVYVMRNDGLKLHFVVNNVVSYPYTDVPAEIIFGSQEGKFLNLITCVGEWVPGQKTYNQRLIVYTTLVE